MHCGVEKIISAVWKIFLLLVAFIDPVNICKSAKSSVRLDLNVSICCSTRGLVGARKRIFDSGYAFSLSTARRSAISVFPNPVGRTQSVFFVFAVSKIAVW